MFLKVIRELQGQDYKVGGIISREIRRGSTRSGFQIEDLANGEKGWLSRVESTPGPKVGKYTVKIDDLERVGVAAILNAIANADLIGIDEIGPMELVSGRFRDSVKEALLSGKLILAVVHQRVQDNLAIEVKNDSNSEVWTVTIENRDRLPEEIASKALGFLERCR